MGINLACHHQMDNTTCGRLHEGKAQVVPYGEGLKDVSQSFQAILEQRALELVLTRQSVEASQSQDQPTDIINTSQA